MSYQGKNGIGCAEEGTKHGEHNTALRGFFAASHRVAVAYSSEPETMQSAWCTKGSNTANCAGTWRDKSANTPAGEAFIPAMTTEYASPAAKKGTPNCATHDS